MSRSSRGIMRFQSPPREGRICCCASCVATHTGFQSPPREGRILRHLPAPTPPGWFPVASPRGEDPALHDEQYDWRRFPVTSPRGEDRVCCAYVRRASQVSSHLPARGGSLFLLDETAELRFPVTSPRGEDLNQEWPALMRGRFPVTSPRGEDRGLRRFWWYSGPVSSHLPARGGSGTRIQGRRDRGVSSHLPARGGSTWLG